MKKTYIKISAVLLAVVLMLMPFTASAEGIYDIEPTVGITVCIYLDEPIIAVILTGLNVAGMLDSEMYMTYDEGKLEYIDVETVSTNEFMTAGGVIRDGYATCTTMAINDKVVSDEEDFICYYFYVLQPEEITFSVTVTESNGINLVGSSFTVRPYILKGDLNDDGKVTSADARIALRISAKLEQADEYMQYVGDVDQNGQITASDARKILRVAAKLDIFD